MNQQQTPLEIEGIDDSIYAGFWSRLGANLLDFIIVAPFFIVIQLLNSSNKDIYFFTVIPSLLFSFWYHVYLPKRYGGTLGKLGLGIKIIRMDGYSIDWTEAILRHSVMLIMVIINSIMTIVAVLEADNALFTVLDWTEQAQYLSQRVPVYSKIYTWTSNIWVYSELIVLLLNDRKRAIHDYIAGTVVVKDKYIRPIQKAMGISKEAVK